jgi:hypothetical protein
MMLYTLIERVLILSNMRLPRIPADKANHIIYGAVIYLLVSILTSSPSAGLSACVLIGISKEFYDLKHKDIHTPDVVDAVATITGGLIIFLYTIFFSK